MQMSDVTEPVLTETELEELKGRVAEGDTEAMVDLGMHYWDEGSDLKKAATLLRQAAMAGDDVAMGLLGEFYIEQKQFSRAQEWYERGAAAGNVYAKIGLAGMYLDGLGIRKNRRRAKKLFTEAAETGDLHAIHVMGQLCCEGNFLSGPDYAEGLQWFGRALEAGDILAASTIGSIYETGGYGVSADSELARQYFEKGASTGDPRGIVALAKYLKYRDPANAEQVVSLYRMAAEKGYSPAMLLLCQAYREGYGTKPSFTSFVRWAKEAALAGNEEGRELMEDAFFVFHDPVDIEPYCNEEACMELFRAHDAQSLYLLGKVVQSHANEELGLDDQLGFLCWEEAAEKGYVPAMLELGLLIVSMAEPEDEFYEEVSKKAFDYLRTAAEAGEIRAMLSLADMYCAGQGTSVDKDQAFYWLQKAVAAHDPDACLQLSFTYMGGPGSPYASYVQPDKKKAMTLLKEAADGGCVMAMGMYGVSLFLGNNVKKDEKEGMRYVQEAADLGDEGVKNFMELLQRHNLDSLDLHSLS